MSTSVWEFNVNSPEPFRQAAVEEWRSWLGEVDDASERSRLGENLQSPNNTRHFSARLELYFHHLFKSKGYQLEWHPALGGTNNHPDLRVQGEGGVFVLEATTRNEEATLAEQGWFFELLKEQLQSVVSPHWVFVDLWSPVPRKEQLPNIIDFLIHELNLFHESSEQEKEIIWEGSAFGTYHRLDFSFHRGAGGNKPLLLTPIMGGPSGLSNNLYHTISGKALRYGELDVPFVIGIWGLQHTEEDEEIDSLCGKLAFTFQQDREGNLVKGSEKWTRKRDGIFTIVEDGKPKHTKVSAVAFYEHTLAGSGPRHSLRVYHNPYALHPLSQEVFGNVPQFVPVEMDDGQGVMRWINSPSGESSV